MGPWRLRGALCALLGQCLWMHIVTSQTDTTSRSFIDFLHPPLEVSKNPVVVVLFHCEREQVVHVDILASSLTKSLVGIFKKRWTCSPDDTDSTRELMVDFPDEMVYREDYFLRWPIQVKDVLLRAWITDYPVDLEKPDRYSFSKGVVKRSLIMKTLPLYSRPYKEHRRTLRWDQDLLWNLTKDEIIQCPVEQEVVRLLSFLYASSGESYGVLRALEPYGDPVLEAQRQRHTTSPRSTFSVWVYFTQWCPAPYCGVLYHLDPGHNYITPAVLMTKTGHLHIQVETLSRKPEAFLSREPVPVERWCHIQLTLEASLGNLTIVCGGRVDAVLYRFSDSLLFSDTTGSFHLGGSKYVPGVSGFYGPSLYYRNRIVPVYQTPLPQLVDRMELPQWVRKCQAFTQECAMRFHHFRQQQKMTGVCTDFYHSNRIRYGTESSGPQSSAWDSPPLPHRVAITRLLRRRVSRAGHATFNGELFGQALYRLFHKKVLAADGFSRMGRSLALLVQAGCLGYYPALYTAAVLHQTGLGVKKDTSKALRFTLIAAQKDERLSQLFLGHKHHLGADGYPVDHDLSYGYYSNIARQTMVDRLQPDKRQAYVENIRLTDENILKQQTKENDDLFMWLRFQARQGVSSAQQAVSRMLFWGQQGISSNPEAAAKIYQKGALQMKDPVMMYDYGIVLLRGQGVKQDIQKALEFLRKAADMNFVPALNSLGWYYEHHEKDYEKAVELWERADKLGNPDAPFNLGILHDNGLIPGKPKNQSAAYYYYLRSAHRGHIDAAAHVSAFWMEGLPGVVDRQPYEAVRWTKWAGEHNGYLGAKLRKALDSYLHNSWPAALLHYFEAAEAGFEVAQFNAAFICEDDPDGLVSRFVQIDCEWKYYNLSTRSDRPRAYALLKMGDLFYVPHVRRRRDVPAAVEMYTAAALQRDPQGLYNLGVLVEEGVSLPGSTLRRLGFNSSESRSNYTVIMELYRRCRDHEREDSYVPCSLALLNAHLHYIWTFHGSVLKADTSSCSSLRRILHDWTACTDELLFRAYLDFRRGREPQTGVPDLRQCSSAAAIAIVTALSLITIFGRLQNTAVNLSV